MSTRNQNDTHQFGEIITRRKFITLASAAAAGLAVIPLGGSAMAAKTEIVIGATLSQSGRFQGIIRPFGKLLQVWADGINAKGGIYLRKINKTLPIRLVIYDDQSSPPTALKFYERNLAALLAAKRRHRGALQLEMPEVRIDFDEQGRPLNTRLAYPTEATRLIEQFMVEANDSAMFEKPNRWRATGLSPAKTEYTRVVQLLAKKGGVKTFALLSRDSLHENQAMEGFGEMVKKAGMEVVYQKIAPKDTRDFSSIILAMKQSKPDVVFIEWIPPPGNIGFLKRARALGLNPKDVVVGHAPVPVSKALGRSMENVLSALYFFEGDSPHHREFFAMCKKAGFEPWQYSEAGIRYVTFKRIEEALVTAGSLEPEDVRRAMWQSNFSLYDGDIRIKTDKKGYGTLHPWPSQIKNGKPVSLWPLSKGVEIFEHKNGQW